VSGRTVVAISPDNGVSWVYKKVNFTGVPGLPEPADPEVVRLDDGTLRMYFTWENREEEPSVTAVYSALSTDGLNFTMEEGARFGVQGERVKDPVVLKIDNTWHLWNGGDDVDGYYSTSDDGLNFDRKSALLTRQNRDQWGIDWVSSGIAVPGGYRLYGFDENNIKSLFSVDGTEWSLDSGVRLSVDPTGGLEKDWVGDCTIVQLLDKSYMMFYVTFIP
jgi:hypothetical protein